MRSAGMQTARSEQVEQREAGRRGAASRTAGCSMVTGQGSAAGAGTEESQTGSAYMTISSSSREVRVGFTQHRANQFGFHAGSIGDAIPEINRRRWKAAYAG
ncbi:hypothetical protein PSAC2689_80195 [Paraburkholderia sacchari]